MKNLSILLLGLSSIVSGGVNPNDWNKIYVNLPQLGYVQGKSIETFFTKRKVFQFHDIKFAESPGGVNRFQPPQPIKPWDGVKDATETGIGCPSLLSIDAIKSNRQHAYSDFEDCLSMTVTTPNVTGNYPVLVYLHGEYMYEGSNSEAAPEYLLEKDIVLVAPQYRLGPFGFLSTKTEAIPGNVAVLDVIMALEFIQQFISSFGGNPDKITLMGQVGSAAIVHLLTLTPIINKRLFHQVIYHSGSALMPAFLSKKPLGHAVDIAKRAGCKFETSVDKLNKCLIDLSTVDLLQAFLNHALANSGQSAESIGGVQFTIGGPSPILPVHPSILMSTQSNFTYAAMGGSPKNAGTRSMGEIFWNDFQHIIQDDKMHGMDYVNHVINQVQGKSHDVFLHGMVTNRFFDPIVLQNGTFKVLLPGLIDLTSTLLHKLPVLLALNHNAKTSPDNTFLFSFDYKGEFNRYPHMDEETSFPMPFKAGVSLTDENIYLFPFPAHVQQLKPTDLNMVIRMIDLWTSFIIDGIPSLSAKGSIWPSMSTFAGPYLKIDETITVSGNYFEEFTITLQDEHNGISLIQHDLYYKSSKKNIFI